MCFANYFRCIRKGYSCLMCRAPDALPPHLQPPSPPPVKQPLIKAISGGGNSVLTAGMGSLSTHTQSSNAFNTNSNSIVSPVRSESPLDFLSRVSLFCFCSFLC